MALHGDVRVNGRRVGAWDAQRTAPLAVPVTEDTVCTYQWTYVEIQPDHKPASGSVNHRYGDGAAALAAKVLAAAAEATAQ